MDETRKVSSENAASLEGQPGCPISNAESEEIFNNLAGLAADICKTPVALISLVDNKRYWFKSKLGSGVAEDSLYISLCTHAMEHPSDIIVIPDTHAWQRCADHPLVIADSNIRFYAGMPLVSHEGQMLGALCVFDRTPRELTVAQIGTLRALGREVMAQLELCHRQVTLEQVNHQMELILNAVGEGIYGLDINGNATFVNPKAAQLWGWDAADLIGKSMHDIVHHSYPDKTPYSAEQCPIHASIREGKTYETDDDFFWRKDGSCFPVKYISTPLIRDGKVLGSVIVFRDITESKRAELALAREREFLDAVLENAQDGIVACNEEGVLTQFNRAAREFHGALEQATPAAQWAERYDLYDPDAIKHMRLEDIPLFRAWQGETVSNVEMVIISKADKRPRNILASGRPLYSHDQRKLGAVVVMHDITQAKQDKEALQKAYEELEARIEQRTQQLTQANALLVNEIAERQRAQAALARQAQELKKSEKVLRKQTRILKSVLDSMAEGVVVVDEHGAFIVFNAAAQAIIGRTSGEKNLEEWVKNYSLYHADRITPYCDHELPLLRAARGENVGPTEVFVCGPEQPKGRLLNVSGRSLRNGNETVCGGLVVFSDITEQKRAEQALQESQEHFRLLVEGATDYAIMMLDLEGRIRSWNQGAERILGYRESEIIGQSSTLFFTEEDKQKGIPQYELETALADGRAQDDRWHVRKGGSLFWASGVLTPLYGKEGDLRGFAKIMRDLTEKKHAEEHMFYIAHHDHLTKLPNRIQFYERLQGAISHARRSAQKMALLLIDLDRFKYVNDTLGHHVGDLLLNCISERLITCVRTTDIVARLGGDEFVIAQLNLAHVDAAAALAEEVNEALLEPFEVDGHEIHSSASIGVTIYPHDSNDLTQLLKNADMAMYRAKSQGGNNYQFFTHEMNEEVHYKRSLEKDLRSAFEKEQLFLHYQPIVDMRSGEITGMEALIRWQHAQLGLIPPQTFIALAEEIGLIGPLGEWVLNTACAQNKAWQDAGLKPIRVEVNLSTRQFKYPRLLQVVEDVLQRTRLEARYVGLEITEGFLLYNTKETAQLLDGLRDRGIHISLDDFGTGYSSLSYLRNFPMDILKIDRSFISNITKQLHDTVIAKALISLAHDLNLQVIAEGVETQEQLAVLREHDCDGMQGYLASHPLPPDKFMQLLQHRSHLPLN